MMARPPSNSKQLIINMVSGVTVFVLNLCISFFLTPYIVDKLGSAAYGFIGLANNIVGYSGLLTIAINSMAGRFVTIEVHKGNIRQANTYLSSVFYANVVFAAIIMLAVLITGIFLEYIIEIPTDLITDVKILYLMVGCSTCLSLFVGIIGVSTFIKNRLDIANMRNIFGNALKAVILILVFWIFIPKLWYFGLATIVMNTYVLIANSIIYHRLTPFLKIRRAFCSIKALLTVAASGVWNIVNKISNMFTRGCELLLANLYVNANSMGALSIAMTLPMLILSFFGMINGNFAPELTRLYSIGDNIKLKQEFFKAIRICGFISAFPLAILIAFGDEFYALWVPGQNTRLLYWLTILGSMELIVGLPIEPLWNIFTITNRIKGSSLYQLGNALVTFATIIGLMYAFSNDTTKIFIIAGVHSAYCLIRNLTFLPIYGAHCLNLKSLTFYPGLLRTILNTAIVIALGFAIKILYLGTPFVFFGLPSSQPSWVSLIIMSLLTCIGAVVISNLILLNSDDRKSIYKKIKHSLRIA